MLPEPTDSLPVSLKYQKLFSKVQAYIFSPTSYQEKNGELRSLLSEWFNSITAKSGDVVERAIDATLLHAGEFAALATAPVEETALVESYITRSFEMMPKSDSFLTWCALTNLFDRAAQSSEFHLLPKTGFDKWESDYAVPLMKVIANKIFWVKELALQPSDIMIELVANPHARAFLKIDRQDEVDWFSRERFGDLAFWIYITILINVSISHRLSGYNREDPAKEFRNELFP